MQSSSRGTAQFQHIRFAVDDRVARITFSRPPLNVLNIAMMNEINRVLDECQDNREIAAVLFDAAQGSRAFCAGVSVEEHEAETIYQMLESFHGIFLNLEAASIPAVAVVDGAALGGGCELVLGCDIVIASERAKFGQPEIKLGVFPPVASILLPLAVGEKKARELILTGDLIDASEALRLGLVSSVVPQAELAQKEAEVLAKLRELSAASLRMTRRSLDMARGLRFEQVLREVEDIYLNDLMKTADANEGIRSFTEKRKPVWKNR